MLRSILVFITVFFLSISVEAKGDSSLGSTNTPPVISGAPQTSVAVNQQYNFQVSAADADDDRLIFYISNKPRWLRFNRRDGLLSGSPSSTDVGEYDNIVISVSDRTETVLLPAFSITVSAEENGSDGSSNTTSGSNTPPVISGDPQTSVAVNQQYSFQVSAADADDDRLIFYISNKPRWLRFNRRDGLLSGSPSSTDVGEYDNIVISVSDRTETVLLPAFSITVVDPVVSNIAPTISGASIYTNEDTSKTMTVKASDPDGNAIHLVVKKAPKFGSVKIAKNSLDITYSPNKDYYGNDSFQLSVIDAHNASSSANFSVTVTPVNDVPKAKADSAIVVEGIAQTIPVLANDSGLGDGNLADGSLRIVIQSQPSQGMVSIKSDGAIKYLSNTNPALSDNFTYKVTDADDEFSIASVSITIEPNCQINCQATLSATWSASESSNIQGYYFYHGTESGNYTDEIWVGNTTSYDYTVNTSGTHFFALKAKNSSGVVSDFSQETHYSF